MSVVCERDIHYFKNRYIHLQLVHSPEGAKQVMLYTYTRESETQNFELAQVTKMFWTEWLEVKVILDWNYEILSPQQEPDSTTTPEQQDSSMSTQPDDHSPELIEVEIEDLFEPFALDQTLAEFPTTS